MGRIKSIMVKRAAKQLLNDDHVFSDNFDHNKRLLGNTMPSKPIRNRIAGYIARLIRAQKNPKVRKKVIASSEEHSEKRENKDNYY